MRHAFMLFCVATTVLSLNEVTVDIFIESQCPGCMEFVNTQLKVALATKDFEKIAKIQIFPYGNARETLNSDGTYSFTCQHGAVECYGNLLDVCIMSRLENSFDKLRVVQCIEEQVQGGASFAIFDKATEVCATKFGLNILDVQQCAKTSEGNLLQHQVAQATANLVPAHKYVPWIVANGAYDEDHQTSIQEDLVKFACTQYKGIERIEACL